MRREIGGEGVAGDELGGERVVPAVVPSHRVSPDGLERDVHAGVGSHPRLAVLRQVAALAAREVEHPVLLTDVRVDEHALDPVVEASQVVNRGLRTLTDALVLPPAVVERDVLRGEGIVAFALVRHGARPSCEMY